MFPVWLIICVSGCDWCIWMLLAVCGATMLDVLWTTVIGGVCPMDWLWLSSLTFLFHFLCLLLIKYLCSKSKFYTPYYQSKFAITRRSSYDTYKWKGQNEKTDISSFVVKINSLSYMYYIVPAIANCTCCFVKYYS